MPICRARIGLKHFQKAIEKFGILGILGILGIPERELCSYTYMCTHSYYNTLRVADKNAAKPERESEVTILNFSNGVIFQ